MGDPLDWGWSLSSCNHAILIKVPTLRGGRPSTVLPRAARDHPGVIEGGTGGTRGPKRALSNEHPTITKKQFPYAATSYPPWGAPSVLTGGSAHSGADILFLVSSRPGTCPLHHHHLSKFSLVKNHAGSGSNLSSLPHSQTPRCHPDCAQPPYPGGCKGAQHHKGSP